jgi:hypothetical protein
MTQDTRIAVITVHGTGDTADVDDGPKWFQRTSTFTEQVKARLAVKGFAADIIPVRWTGANSARARETAADELADEIKGLRREYGGQVHVIAHSHGGNVANEAASHLRWGRRPGKERIASLTTVGTPFFKVRTGAAERFAAFAFLGLCIVSTLIFVLAAIAVAVLAAEGDVTVSDGSLPVFAAIGAATGVALYFMLRLSVQGYRRVTKPVKQAETDEAVHAIWHRNDEAIAFLQKVEGMPIQPFAPGAWRRQSRQGGIVWGVRAVLVLGVLGLLMFVPGLASANGSDFLHGVALALDSGEDPSMAGFFLLLLAPIAFVAVYGLYRLFFGVVPDAVVRPGANKAVEGALKGMAFGRDGDERLSQVSVTSHTLPTVDVTLDGPLAERLQQNAAGAAAALIEKYRWSLFTVGSDTNAALSDIATDAMTWDSLIHTTYFDHQETAEMIADHIAVRAALRL